MLTPGPLIRFLFKSKSSTLINVFGLSISLAGVILIYLFITQELSYDNFHADRDRIYRVVLDNKTPSGTTRFVTTGPPVGPVFVSELTQVESYARIKRGDEHLVTFEDKSFYESNLCYVDTTFFSFFSFDLLYGDESTALKDVNSVVITEQIALKYFGRDNPLGKQFLLDGTVPLVVTGVLKAGNKSHLQIDLLVSFISYPYPDFGRPDDWTWITFHNYLKLRPGASAMAVEEEMNRLIGKYFGEDRRAAVQFHLQLVTDIYLASSPESSNELGPTSDLLYTKILFTAGLLLLFIAGFNFVNISTAQAYKRAKEVGIKKALGASRASLIIQFLLESFIINFFAVVVSLGWVYILLSSIDELFGLSFNLLSTHLLPLLAGLSLISFLFTLLAGSYPALVLSGFKAKEIIKGGAEQPGSHSVFRKVLVGAQFVISSLLIIGTLVIQKQLSYVRSKDLGFNKNNVLVVPLRNEDMQSRYAAFESRLEQNQAVELVGAARLGLEGLHGSYQYVPQGKEIEDAPRMSIYPVHYDFIETLSIPVVGGRTFSRDFSSDTLHQFIMNESAIRVMGWDADEAINQRGMLTGQGGIHGVVVGVVKDFHFEPLRSPIDPLILWLQPNSPNYVYIKFHSISPTEVIRQVEDDFQMTFQGYPFEYQFLDDRVMANYEEDTRFGRVFLFFSLLAIGIGCMGLIGLTTHVIAQRRKEIGIRKLLGATTGHILFRLNREFLIVALLATVIAIPLGYFTMEQWLNNFAYQAPVGVGIFLYTVCISLLITLLTVSYFTIAAAMSNPVKVIKYE